MAGGGPVGGPKKKKHPEGEDFIRHPASRVSIYIDMTPMVDVAMLLLIFFMVTTVFRNPQAMELNLPTDQTKVDVPESNVLTVAVREDGNMYQRTARNPWRPIKVDEIKPTVEGLVAQRPQIIALIKVAPGAPYHHVVDIMDELNLARFNRLSILRLENPDLQEVQGIP